MNGDQLRAWRLELGWTQLMAATKLGVSLGTYSAWERGTYPIHYPRMLALACEAIALDIEPTPRRGAPALPRGRPKVEKTRRST